MWVANNGGNMRELVEQLGGHGCRYISSWRWAYCFLMTGWFRLFCNSYMFGVVICHICAFISNRTRTFEWMIVSFLNYIWNYLKFIWLFLKLIWTIWNPFGHFWNWFELSENHLEFSEFDLNYLKFICTFLNSTWTIWNSFGFFWIRPEKGVVFTENQLTLISFGFWLSLSYLP